MKTYNVRELIEYNPELFDKCDDALKQYLPHIAEHVRKSLDDQEFMIAEHSTFVRLVDEDDKMYYVEIRTFNMISDTRLVSAIHSVTLYDSFDQYEHARISLTKHHEATQYNGKRL